MNNKYNKTPTEKLLEQKMNIIISMMEQVHLSINTLHSKYLKDSEKIIENTEATMELMHIIASQDEKEEREEKIETVQKDIKDLMKSFEIIKK